MGDAGEILFVGGRFVDPSVGADPIGEALLARGGRIACIGSETACRAEAGAGVEAVDLGGRTVIPGLVDAHVHLRSLGASLEQCDLSAARSRREAVEIIAAFAADHAETPWVRARGYQLNAWADPAYPTAGDLDEAVADRPCLAVAFDGHSAWANSAALAAAGLSRDAADPPGGALVRDAKGRPTGYFLEAAAGCVHQAARRGSPEDLDAHYRAAIAEMVRRGHTAVHAPLGGDEGPPTAAVERINRLWPGNSCPVRIRFFSHPGSVDAVAAARSSRRADDRVQLAGIKCFLDGSLGSRTAWMFEPMADGLAGCGIQVLETARLREHITAANHAGMPVICHAIGDRACAEALAAFRDAGQAHAGNRIEHAQFLRPAELDLFARAGAAASVQPGHILTDWQPANRLLGDRRARWAFPFRSLLDRGAVLAMGSDAPVVPPSLQDSLHAAVTRTDATGQPEGGWFAQERITPLEWAEAASHGAWRSIGEGDLAGRLAPGMACDLCVLSEDVFAPGRADYRRWHVAATVVAGRFTSGR